MTIQDLENKVIDKIFFFSKDDIEKEKTLWDKVKEHDLYTDNTDNTDRYHYLSLILIILESLGL